MKDFKGIPVISKLNRREVFSFVGAAAAALFVGHLREQSASGQAPTQTPTQTVTTPGCIVRPQQTEGPYFVDEQLNRSDIRSNPSDGLVKTGVELRLVFQVSRIDGNSCTSLAGAVVDVWHCDALGVYSDVQDRSSDTRGQKFLRGYQVTDKNGMAQFITIFPGWYQGRTAHIHFKIRTDTSSQAGYEFTSQLYFDDSLTDQIHAQAPYTNRGQRTLKNDQDYLFQGEGEELMPQLTKDTKCYVGIFPIGLQIA